MTLRTLTVSALAFASLALLSSGLSPVNAQSAQVRTEKECRDYKVKGAFGIGGIKPPTTDGRKLTECRTCRITVRRFFLDKKVCEAWPALPNG